MAFVTLQFLWQLMEHGVTGVHGPHALHCAEMVLNPKVEFVIILHHPAMDYHALGMRKKCASATLIPAKVSELMNFNGLVSAMTN